MSLNSKTRRSWHDVAESFDNFAANLGGRFNFQAAMLAGGTGELLVNHEITGHPGADLAIKVGIPILTGVVVPLAKDVFALFREWLKDRKEDRKLRRAELEAKKGAGSAHEKEDQ